MYLEIVWLNETITDFLEIGLNSKLLPKAYIKPKVLSEEDYRLLYR